MPIDTSTVQDWLDRYVAAWRTYDPGDIGTLFSEDVVYRYHPGDPPVMGRDAVVASWLEDRDPDGSWNADYRVWAVSGDMAAATGETHYADGSHYFNVFLLRFRGAECCEFTEFFLTPRAS